MIVQPSSRALFTGFAFLFQVCLLANFSVRRWRPALERRYGWLVYALSLPALLLSAVFLADGEPSIIWAGPLVLFAWGGFGY